jgi:hypothetical protein
MTIETRAAGVTYRTAQPPRTVLWIDGTLLTVAGGAPLSPEQLGHHAARGPLVALEGSPHASGWVEDHGLVLLTGMLAPTVGARQLHGSWHVLAVAAHVLLATANVLFWSSSTLRDTVPTGAAATTGHSVHALADARRVVLSRRPAWAPAGRVTGSAA